MHTDQQLVLLPVGLSDSVDWRQLAHQQFEDSGFTGTIFTNLPGNNKASAAAASLIDLIGYSAV